MIYAVVPLQRRDIEILEEKLEKLEVPMYREQAPYIYLVIYEGTTKELAETIGYGDNQKLGTALVVPIENYAGYAPKNLWEWIRIYGRK